MKIEVTKDDVIKTFDSFEEFMQHTSEGRPTRQMEDLRPVLALTIDNPVYNGGFQRNPMELRENLVEAVSLTGYQPEQVNVMECVSQWQNFELDRNLKWKDLPVVTTPVFAFSSYILNVLKSDGKVVYSGADINGLDGSTKRSFPELCREHVKALVISCFEPLDEYVFRGLAAFTDVPDIDLPIVVVNTPNERKIIPHTDVVKIRDRYLAEGRFLANHAENFAILARRALVGIAYEDAVTKNQAFEMLPGISTYGWEWAHPFFLQLLHFLKDEGLVGTHEDRLALRAMNPPSFMVLNLPHIYARGISLFEPTNDGYDLVWKGTGAYPEWRVALGNAVDPVDHHGSMLRSNHLLFKCFHHTERTGLLGIRDGRIVLSPWGVRFLELLGPESNDPDVLLRWRTADGELGGKDDIKAMDRWLNRVFRATKRRLSSINDTLSILEKGDFPADAQHNKLSIYGAYIPLNDADFCDPAIVAALIPIEADKEKPFGERRCGIIYDLPRLGVEEKAVGAWFGVPLEIISSEEARYKEPGFLRDKFSIQADADRAMRGIPVALHSKLTKSTPDVVNGISVAANRVCFRDLPWNITSDPEDEVYEIIKGDAAQVDLKSEMSDEARTYMLISGSRRKALDMSCFDGLQSTGTGPNRAIVCGQFVGLYNATKDTFVLEAPSSERDRQFAKERPRLMANAHYVFEHAKPKFGYWAVFTDGTVKELDI